MWPCTAEVCLRRPSCSCWTGHVFEKDRPVRVCGNTALMLSQTRLRGLFEVTGSFDRHFGAFPDCGAPGPQTGKVPFAERGCSC